MRSVVEPGRQHRVGIHVRRLEPHRTPRHSVLLIGSEAVPFAKTGGLADVLGVLPIALAGLGWSATLVLPRYRGITAGRLVEQFPISIGGYTRDVGFYEAPLADGRERPVRRLPGPVRSRRAVRRGRRRLPGQPATLRPAGARGSRVCRPARERTVRRARARLAGGSGAGLSEDAVRVAPGARRHAQRLHDSQPRLSGAVRARLAAAPRPAVGRCSRWTSSNTGGASAC